MPLWFLSKYIQIIKENFNIQTNKMTHITLTFVLVNLSFIYTIIQVHTVHVYQAIKL